VKSATLLVPLGGGCVLLNPRAECVQDGNRGAQ
jgi:hypothetical protein